MEIRKINFWFIIAIIAFVFFFLGYWTGQQYLIEMFREELGMINLCKLIIG